ncbi:cache domain-containing protein [Marinospirillum sp.]|uniref:cache domain-containing protein n=1 Tax=Marinospirillum sp. TaxID=2183934 RepID=UPI00384D82A4
MPANRLHLNFNKKLLLVYTSILLISLLMVGQGLYALHNNLMDDRRQSIRQLVKNTLSLLDHYQQQTHQGLSLEQAQQQALQAVRSLRYGERGYFWINDLDTRMLAHPIWPEMEGHLQEDYQDSHGQYIFRSFVDRVKNQQGGFVHYHWPKPDDTQPIEKLSYVELYEPWGWVLGSGIYLDDMEKIFWQEARIYGLSFGVLLIIISYLLWSILRVDTRAFQSNKLMTSVMEACAEAIMVTDEETQIIWANTAFEHLTGYSAQEVYGKKPGEIIRSGKQDAHFYQQMWFRLNQGQYWTGELINRRKNGDLYYEQMTITPVKNRSGKISHYVAIKKDISRRKQDQLRLEELASRDSLTGLNNRRTFMERLTAHLEMGGDNKGVLMMLDLDHFKHINDSFGHQCGDQVLIGFAELISSQLREQDLLGRLGGEEFGLLVPGVSFAEGMQLAEKLCQALQNHPIVFNQLELQVTTSIGVTQITSHDTQPDTLLDRADKGLYLAKQSGRACVRSPD